jgi:hypothetical protein
MRASVVQLFIGYSVGLVIFLVLLFGYLEYRRDYVRDKRERDAAACTPDVGFYINGECKKGVFWKKYAQDGWSLPMSDCGPIWDPCTEPFQK